MSLALLSLPTPTLITSPVVREYGPGRNVQETHRALLGKTTLIVTVLLIAGIEIPVRK